MIDRIAAVVASVQIDKGIPRLRILHDRRGLRNHHERKTGRNARCAQRHGHIFDAENLFERRLAAVLELVGQDRILRLFIFVAVHTGRDRGTADVNDAHAAVAFLIEIHQRIGFTRAGIHHTRSRQERVNRAGHDLFAEIGDRNIVDAQKHAESLLEDVHRSVRQRGRICGFPFARIDVDDDDHILVRIDRFRGIRLFARIGRGRCRIRFDACRERCDHAYRQEQRKNSLHIQTSVFLFFV